MATRKTKSRRRRRPRGDLLWQLLVPITLLVVVAIVGVLVVHPAFAPPKVTPPPCPKAAAVIVGTVSVPAGPIQGYCQPQLEIAAQIIRAAQSYGLDAHGQEIGVMTAIGESGLRNVNYGDVAGPDSRGIFQQRDNYGALADRMDPYTAARAFFGRMIGVANWPTLPPTQVAHTVQGNADPDYYTQFWQRAVKIVTALDADAVPQPSAVPAG
jgi:hypothetical protein